MSKWKYVRKSTLDSFGKYRENQGILIGLFAGFMGYAATNPSLTSVLMALLPLMAYVWLWYISRDHFSRIRKAIEDAGGDT